MFNLGMGEMALIAIIALIFIGPKQLPEIARSVARLLNEFKRTTTELSGNLMNPKSYHHHDHNPVPPHEDIEPESHEDPE